MFARTVRFGVMAAQRDDADYTVLRDFCLHAERLGYDSVWIGDHLLSDLPQTGREAALPGRELPLFETWTVLATLVPQTTRIRLGTLTFCNSFRHPPLVAKMIATLDVISNGRLEVGIGAGWHEAEHACYGYDFPPVGERIKRMGEAVEIWKLMWTETSPSFEGRYYRIREAVCEPKPVQKPYPPLLIGGVGEQLTFKVVAQHADRWNCTSLSLDAIKAKIAVLDQRCKEIGRDPATLDKTLFARVIIGPEPMIGETLRQRAAVRGRSVEQFTGKMIAGTPEQCVARVQQYIDAGVSYFVLDWESLRDFDSLDLFAQKVLPRFR